MNKINIDVFTDPTCPFAYSLEPVIWRLKWLYGDSITWNDRMIVLSGYNGEISPMTPKLISQSRKYLRSQHEMPMNITEMPRVSKSYLVCKSYVAVKCFAPKFADLFLRNLRIASMNNALLDEQIVVDEVAVKTGLTPSDIHQWLDNPKTTEALTTDAIDARNPGINAKHYSHKLSTTSTGVVRYPASSFVFSYGDTIYELPGFWPLEAYEAIIGNLIPKVQRNDDPAKVIEVLKWANTPLATIELVTIMNTNTVEAREKAKSVANFTPVGQDGFWTLK